MPWAVAAAGVSAVGALAGGAMSAGASNSAANQVAQSQANTLGFQEGVYNNTVANLQPYVNTGTSALTQLANFYGLNGGTGTQNAANAFSAFQQTPAYTFALQQGNLGANRALAAAGLSGSGAATKALEQYGQGYASQQFGTYISQLQSLAGMGQSAAAQTGSLGNQAGGTIAGANTATGNALGSATIGGQNAINSGISSALGAFGSTNVQDALKSLTASSYGSGNGSGASP